MDNPENKSSISAPVKKHNRPTERSAEDTPPRSSVKTARPGLARYTMTFLHHGNLKKSSAMIRNGLFYYWAKFAETGDKKFMIEIHSKDIDRIRRSQWPGSNGKVGKIKEMGSPRPVTVLLEWRRQDQPVIVRSLRPKEAAEIAVEEARRKKG